MTDRATILRVAIVGGGITGLAAAYAAIGRARELGRAVSVTVLEASKRFGGHLVTERTDGFLLDGGPDSWVASKPEASALARELGLGDSLMGTNPATRRYYVAWDARLHAVPEGLVLGVPTRLGPLARTRLFSWVGKARMALEPFVPSRRFAGDEDESIVEFATRRLGREATERLVAPLLGGISAADASDISVRAAFPQLVAMEQDHGSLVLGMRAARRAGRRARPSERGESAGSGAAAERRSNATNESAFLSLPGGMGELVGALVDRLRGGGSLLRSGAQVLAIARRDRAWTLVLATGERIEAEVVLFAVPAYVAAGVLTAVDAPLASELGAIAYGSTATVFLAYRRSAVAHPLDGVGFVVPRALGRPILAGTWVSSKWSGRAPEGHVLLRAFVGGACGEPLLTQGDDGLVEAVRRELRALMALEAEPVLARVFRFDRASAQMRVGHLAAMRRIHERLRHAAPGIRVAGGGYEGLGIPDCVRQGQEAGKAMVEVAR